MNKILEIIMASRDCMSRHLANLEVERVEASENWLVGEEFSLADITMGCLLQRLDESNWLTHFQNTQPLSNVISYFEAVKARPSWKEAITDIKHPAIYSGAIALKAAVEKDNALHAALYGT